MDHIKNRLNETLKYSYSPYSNLRVASLIETKSGKLYSGTNIENASYGLSICAERVAICKAISEGEKEFKAVYVSWYSKVCTFSMIGSDNNDIKITPCGACRQFLAEHHKSKFNPDLEVYCFHNDDDSVFKSSIRECLPFAFDKSFKNK